MRQTFMVGTNLDLRMNDSGSISDQLTHSGVLSIWRFTCELTHHKLTALRPVMRRDRSGGGSRVGRNLASHVCDQRILKCCPELDNLSLGQPQFRNRACSFLQL